jgi:hypothetical protein
VQSVLVDLIDASTRVVLSRQPRGDTALTLGAPKCPSTHSAVDNRASLCRTGGADVLSRGELGLGIPPQGLSHLIRWLSTIEHGG